MANNCVVNYGQKIINEIDDSIGDISNLSLEDANKKAKAIQAKFDNKEIVSFEMSTDKKSNDEVTNSQILEKEKALDRSLKEIGELKQQHSETHDVSLRTFRMGSIQQKEDEATIISNSIERLKSSLGKKEVLKMFRDDSLILELAIRYQEAEKGEKVDINKDEHLKLIQELTPEKKSERPTGKTYKKTKKSEYKLTDENKALISEYEARIKSGDTSVVDEIISKMKELQTEEQLQKIDNSNDINKVFKADNPLLYGILHLLNEHKIDYASREKGTAPNAEEIIQPPKKSKEVSAEKVRESVPKKDNISLLLGQLKLFWNTNITHSRLEGLNFSNYVASLKEIRNKVTININTLKQKEKLTPKDIKDIQVLTTAQTYLGREIGKFNSLTGDKPDVFSSYISVLYHDLSEINRLLNDKTVHSAEVVEERIKAFQGLLDLYHEGEKSEDPKIVGTFAKLEAILNSLKRKQVEVERDLSKELVSQYINDQKALSKKIASKSDAEIEDLVDQIMEHIENPSEDMNGLEAFLIDNTGNRGDLNKILAHIISKRKKQQIHKSTQDKLSRIIPIIKERLSKLGLSQKIFIQESDQNYRLIGRYSSEYDKLLDSISFELHAIDQIPSTDQNFRTKAHRQARLLKKIEKSTDIINVSLLPEIRNDGTFSELFQGELKDTSYSDEIRERIGDTEYKLLIQEQRFKLIQYLGDKHQRESNIRDKFGMSIQELTKYVEDSIAAKTDPKKWESHAALLTKYNETLAKRSPYSIFSKKRKTEGLSQGTLVKYDSYSATGKKEGLAAIEVNSLSYIPKKENTEHFDSNFDRIKNDEVLMEAWELLRESYSFINGTSFIGKYNISDRSLQKPNPRDVTRNKSKSYLGINADDIKKRLSEKLNRPWSERKVSGLATPLDEEIRLNVKKLFKIFRHKLEGVDMREKMTLEGLSDEQLSSLESYFGRKFTAEEKSTEGTLKDILTKIYFSESQRGEKVLEQTAELLGLAEDIQARKELAPVAEFLFRGIEKQKNIHTGKSRERYVGSARRLLKMNIYKMFEKSLYDPKDDTKRSAEAKRIGILLYTKGDKVLVKQLLEGIKILEEALEQDPDNELIKNEIKGIEDYISSRGKVLNLNTVVGVVFLKLARVKAFAGDVGKQIKNFFQGMRSAEQLDFEGSFWPSGNLYKAMSYTKFSKRPFRNREQKRVHRITDQLLNSLNLWQDPNSWLSAVDKSDISSKVKRAKKLITDPLTIVSETEKLIQTKQILAMLSGVFITGKDGRKVPAFNAENLSDPHPAFDLDSNGYLTLKEEFRTEANKDTWINNKGEEHSMLFADFGKIPSAIAWINGDYRNTTSYHAQETTAFSLLLLFKRWFPAYIEKQVHYINPLLKTKGAGYAGAAALGSSMFWMGASLGWALPVVFVMANISKISALTSTQRRKQLFESLKDLHESTTLLEKATKAAKFMITTPVKFIKKGEVLRMPFVVVMKAVHMITGRVLGRGVISQDYIKKIGAWDKIKIELSEEQRRDGVTEEEQLVEIQNSLNYFTGIAAQSLIVGMVKLVANMIEESAYDEDDEEEYESLTLWEKAYRKTGMFALKAVTYTSKEALDELLLFANTLDVLQLISPNSTIYQLHNFYKLFASFTNWDDQINSEGQSRSWIAFLDAFFPKSISPSPESSFPNTFYLSGGLSAFVESQKDKKTTVESRVKDKIKDFKEEARQKLESTDIYKNATKEGKEEIISWLSFFRIGNVFDDKGNWKEEFLNKGDLIHEKEIEEWFNTMDNVASKDADELLTHLYENNY